MGLDMYAYKTKADLNGQEVDFSNNNVDTEDLHYWRKHPNLHGWMEELYYEKGGKDDSFNGSCVVLTEGDLDTLEEDIKNGNLPQTSGFFFGQSDGEEVNDDLEFVAKAREAIEAGETVYYSSWW
jgi:hypothetical protein